jgi:hypothetical protein
MPKVANMTAQEVANSPERERRRTTLLRAVYLMAIGAGMVGWLCLLAWCALALLGH